MTREGNKKRRWYTTVLAVILAIAIVAVVVVAGTNFATISQTKNDIVTPEQAASYEGDAIVVLGASVFADGTPSRILQDRLDDGIDLYFAGAAPKIIMSGDNSTVAYNEVKAMKDYAISRGVPSEDIFCDHAGFSTYESMYRAKHVFGAQRIIVATQTYHLYRALYAAHGLGLEAIGVPSDYRDYQNQPIYDLREIPARTKDFFKVLLEVPSTFVGDPISLSQSGDITEGEEEQSN
ncbi:SanA/YdcF family protein [Adlercreutzia agrestimuris]|uniref:SanA/YdcF family protein n=1 Tax=Adlercreutzia agrestimuris TaxID=2941324 RepID=UPI0020410E4D|nr:ElyC/SanA/YdcF family protein [Adlercreutzia agrestimuris]